MIPGFDLNTFVTTTSALVVVLVIAIIIFAESGLLIGFFLPGDTLLFTAGFLISAGQLHFDLLWFIAIMFAAAVLGDGVGYLFGKRVGRRIFNRPNSRLFRKENLERAEQFYDKYGAATVVIARFIPMIRTFAPIVAGVGKMSYRKFLTYNLIGAFLWAGGVSYLGFYLGDVLHQMGIEIDTIILPIMAVIVVISIASPLLHSVDFPRMWKATKKQLSIIFRKK
jgi:membrane-associated protein